MYWNTRSYNLMMLNFFLDGWSEEHTEQSGISRV